MRTHMQRTHPHAGARAAIPDEAIVAIETLLPTGKGRFLELWAPRGVHRPGWTHGVEVGAAEAGALLLGVCARV